MERNTPIAEIEKIAVLRANALGDFVVSLPALQALRNAYPEAEIVYLGKKWHVNFLASRPSPVDRVIDVPVSKGVNIYIALQDDVPEDPVELEDFFKRMQAENFDLGIQLHGGGRYSNPFLLNCQPRISAGMKTPDAVALDRWMPYEYWQHETLRLLECVAQVGAYHEDIQPHLAVTRADMEESKLVCPDTLSPIVILHPGASDPRRRWDPANFAAVGDALAQAGAHVYVTGVSEEGETVQQVVSSMHHPAIPLVNTLSINGLAGLLYRAALVVSNDTGPRHLAAAVGTPTVGIYWCGNLINAGPLTRTHHRPLISWTLECPVCGVNTLQGHCDHTVSFVNEITVEQVEYHAIDLLHNQSKNMEREPVYDQVNRISTRST